MLTLDELLEDELHESLEHGEVIECLGPSYKASSDIVATSILIGTELIAGVLVRDAALLSTTAAIAALLIFMRLSRARKSFGVLYALTNKRLLRASDSGISAIASRAEIQSVKGSSVTPTIKFTNGLPPITLLVNPSQTSYMLVKH